MSRPRSPRPRPGPMHSTMRLGRRPTCRGTDCPHLIQEEAMATCEYILDVANYKPIPPLPPAGAAESEAELQRRRMSHNLARAARDTTHRFFLAVRWFLAQQVNFTAIAVAAGDQPATDEGESKGLQIVTTVTLGVPSISDADKARFLAVAGLLIADSQLDALNGK